MDSHNKAINDALVGTNYRALTVQWNDAKRTTGSCWGPNITDVTLESPTGETYLVIRPENFNETVQSVSASNLSIMKATGPNSVKPVSLANFLQNPPRPIPLPLYDDADDKVCVRYQAVFVPEKSGADGIHVTHFNYTASDSDPTNLLLLSTTQGTALHNDGSGKVPLYLQHNGNDYEMKVTGTRFVVGGSQCETKVEKEKARKAGLATSEIIGPIQFGTRLNILGVIQVPLKKEELTVNYPSMFGLFSTAFSDSSVQGCGGPSRGCSSKKIRKSKSSDVSIGMSSAGRVSIGQWVRKSKPYCDNDRAPSSRLTATYMIYYVTKDGVPSAEDVSRAVADLDNLYRGSTKLFDSEFVTDEKIYIKVEPEDSLVN